MSNLVFSRRSIQSLISQLQYVLPLPQLEGIVRPLNETDRISAMWEVVFLAALSRIGAIRHEITLPSGRRPDFGLNCERYAIVGDITSVSDAGRHDENPVDMLEYQIRRLAIRHNLNANYFHCYDDATSLTKNPIFKALEKKAHQLRTAPSNAVRLVIACDAGCAPFRAWTAPRHYSAQEIAADFLRQRLHNSIDLVLLATVDAVDSGGALKMRYSLVSGRPAQESPHFENGPISRLSAPLLG